MSLSCFLPHHEVSVPGLHHTLNTVYDVDLYETDFHFIFNDVPKNGLTELYKDTPERLKAYMSTHIKTESGATSRSETDKVEALFKLIQISYQLSTDKLVHFKRGQELAAVIQHFLKHQPQEVLPKCIEILFSTSRIYLSLVGVVDGLNMDKLFSEEQAFSAPSSSTTATVTAGTHLETITNTMSISVIGLTRKVAANHAHANRDVAIDYKDMPTDVREQCDSKNHYHNDLTLNKHNCKQKWRS